LTAGTIMEDPEPVVYAWQGPRVAHALIHRSKREFAFVLDKHHKATGVLTHAAVNTLIKESREDISSAIITNFETCTPDMTVEELFPLATASPFPIAVIEEGGRLAGYIRNTTIIESMIQNGAEGEEDPHDA